jgi:hypothetical protein
MEQQITTKKHINDLWLVKLRLWENHIKKLNEERKVKYNNIQNKILT